MFLQRSPTVPNASPRQLPGGTVGTMLNHHVFPYGNCRRNRSTESLPELPIPKLTERPGQTKTNSKHESAIRDFFTCGITCSILHISSRKEGYEYTYAAGYILCQRKWEIRSVFIALSLYKIARLQPTAAFTFERLHTHYYNRKFRRSPARHGNAD